MEETCITANASSAVTPHVFFLPKTDADLKSQPSPLDKTTESLPVF